MPRVRNKYCDIIQSRQDEEVPDHSYDSWQYRGYVANALFWAFIEIDSRNYIDLAKEIDVYPILVWEVLENWIRYGILTAEGKIVIDEDAFENELAAQVEIALICLCGAGLVARKEVESPSLDTPSYNPCQVRTPVPLLSKKVEREIRREMVDEKPREVNIRHKCPACGRCFKEFPRFGACPSCDSPVGSFFVEKI